MSFAKLVTPKRYTNRLIFFLIKILFFFFGHRVMLNSMRFPPDVCHKLASKKQSHYCGKQNMKRACPQGRSV